MSVTKTSLLAFLFSSFMVFSIGLSGIAASPSYNTDSQLFLQRRWLNLGSLTIKLATWLLLLLLPLPLAVQVNKEQSCGKA
jgi:hypothetical protein